ncbi:MAG: response regulator [bacterium]|nr:response regulator [bacterium]
MWQSTWFLLVPLSALLMGCVAALIAWPRRSVPGATVFLLSAGTLIEWGTFNALEIATTDLRLKLVFFGLKVVGLVYCGVFLFFSVLQFTGRKRWLNRWVWTTLLVIPFLFVLALWTDRWHGAFMARIWLSPPEPYIALKYQQTIVSGGMYFFAVGVMYITVLIAAWSVFGATTVHPLQVAATTGVLVLLTVFTPYSILGFNPVRHTDLGPLVMGIGLTAFALAFYNKRVHGIIPGTRATLYESLRDGILVLDGTGRVIEIWPAAEHLLGVNASVVLGEPVERIFETSLESVEDEEGMDRRLMRTADGARYLELDRSAMRTAKGDSEGELLIFHDVTDRLAVEDERRQLESQIQHAQKLDALGRLSGGVAHDFNNILTIVLMNAELAKTILDRDKVREHLTNIEDASARAADLVKQLLVFSRTPQVEMRPIEVPKLLNEAVHMLSETFDRRIRIERKLQGNLPHIRGNQAKVQQVLLNLCLNARDAILEAHEEGESLAGDQCITIAAEEIRFDGAAKTSNPEAAPGDYVRVSVSDTGAGMDEVTRRQVFEPFFTTKVVGKGTGLGLSIVYGIVRQHKGWLDVVSESGAGSTFHVYLPAMAAEVTEQSLLDEETLPPHGTGVVLMVDDEELILEAGAAMLEDLEYTPILASRGSVALRIFEERHEEIAAVVLDLSMPEMSGYDVLREMRKIDEDIPVIISSGYSTSGLSKPLEEIGAAAFLPKPYRTTEIAHVLRRALDERGTETDDATRSTDDDRDAVGGSSRLDGDE